jgi:hypothetical protein
LRFTSGEVSDSVLFRRVQSSSFHVRKVLTNLFTDKYLPALKCLQALEALDAEHAALKDQRGRLRSALSPMPEDVPEKAREVLQSEFLSKQ